MIVNRLAGLTLPASSKYLIDDIIGRRRVDRLVPLVVFAGVAMTAEAITAFALSQTVSVAAQRAITDMRRRINWHVLRLPTRYFDSTRSGALVARIIGDAEGIRNLIGSGFVQLVGSVITAIIALAVLIYLNWALTIVTVLLLVAYSLFMAGAFRRLRPLARDRSRAMADVTGRLVESLGGIRILKVYAAERREALTFVRGIHRVFRVVARSVTANSAVSAGSGAIISVVGVLTLLIGGRAVSTGHMTLGDFVLYTFFTNLLATPLAQVASVGTQLSEALAGLDRINQLRDTPTEDEDEPRAAVLPRVTGRVIFDRVTFEYEPGMPVLTNVSFEALPGTTTALVGPSGSGKSTLISLLMALNRPTTGRVLVDGHDITLVKPSSLRAQLGVVLQDNILFDGTIRENIAFGRPAASEAEIRLASEIGHCAEFIDRLPKGYDTPVGERGVRLSGGQRQRIAIARALLSDPRLLILDEPTSNLDSESEMLVREAIHKLRRGRTTFVIAHRFATVEHADQILVLSAGKVVERGTHAELLEHGVIYRALYDRQQSSPVALSSRLASLVVTPTVQAEGRECPI